MGDDAGDAVALDQQIGGGLLEHSQIRLTFDQRSHRRLIERPVGLTAGGAHRWPFAAVEDAKLDAGAVGGLRHDPAERVDFLDQMALADAADGRVAAHRAHGFDGVGQQQGVRAGTRGGHAGFGAGVAAADDDGIENFGVTHDRFALLQVRTADAAKKTRDGRALSIRLRQLHGVIRHRQRHGDHPLLGEKLGEALVTAFVQRRRPSRQARQGVAPGAAVQLVV